jgi:hypothetical protein
MKKVKPLILFACSMFLSGCYETETGDKVGQIISVRRSGIIFKTWQCTLVRGGFQDGSGSQSGKMELTIERDDVLKKIIEAMESRRLVRINYHQEFFCMPCRSGTDGVFLDGVELDS